MSLEKPLTIKSWSRRGGECPMGSSLPNHDAKDWKWQTKKRQKKKRKKEKKQGQTTSDMARAQENKKEQSI